MTNYSFNFTKNLLLKIKCPKVNQDTYKDTQEKGLVLIASYGGSKTFYLAKNIREKDQKKRYHRIKIVDFLRCLWLMLEPKHLSLKPK